MINRAILEAYKILDDKESIDRELIMELSRLEGADVMDLLSLANKVKAKYASDYHVCTIMNAKSGACEQDCRYCAQSAFHKTDVEVYPLAARDRIYAEALKTYENGVRNFGIVTSGYGFTEMDDDFRNILEAIDMIHEKLPDMEVCASLGILSEENAKALAERKILHYNINLQVNTKKYKELVATTHSAEDRVKTINYLKSYGVGVCCGGIIGLGESLSDRIEMAYEIKGLGIEVVPLNVLIPLEGTAMEGAAPTSVLEIAKTFALFRLILPDRTIKFAAGRETKMKDFQALIMLSGANGILTGGYLTTRGRDTAEDSLFLDELKLFGGRVESGS